MGIPGGITPEEFEIRRRIIWAAFSQCCPNPRLLDSRAVIDKIISLYQGRPVSFDEERMHVPHRFLDRYEEQEVWMPFAFSSSRYYPGQPAQAISTFSSLCSLSVIMVRAHILRNDVVTDTRAASSLRCMPIASCLIDPQRHCSACRPALTGGRLHCPQR